MNKNSGLSRYCCAFAALGLAAPVVSGEETPRSDERESSVLEKVMVVGNPADIEKIPGSAQLVTKEEIREQNYDDINRVLRRVPGVYVREEDGFGLFPSISIRGVDTTRNAKITVMEDGVMMAPAPYSAPAAYYTPTVGRMSGVEVLKGSSQIKYGPHTTGGVINYLSTPIPTRETAYLKSSFGSFEELRTHAYVGNTIDSRNGRIGVLVEGYKRQNKGFKHIDETPDFRNGDDTGFSKNDALIKLSWEPATEIYQRIELKHGSSDLDANETYLGLTDSDFERDPLRRYAASRFDNMDSRQTQTSLRYAVSPSDHLDVIATLYDNRFKRNWYKLNKVDGQSLAKAMATPGTAQECMKGNAACELRVKANNRKYRSRGIDLSTYYRFGQGRAQHEINAGVRLHEDQVRRFQWEDRYAQNANGTISGKIAGIPGTAGDRLQKTEALAVFVQDTIEMGRLTVVPGVRYEKLDQTSEDPKGTLQGPGGTKGRDGKNSFDMAAGGVGAAWRFNERWTGFGGVHTGFSPPSPRATRSGLDPETSIAFEVGARYSDVSRALAAEATLFNTRFRDLVVIDNVGGVGSGDTENFGEVNTSGLELAVQYDAGIANGWRVRNPWYLSLTWTNAEQMNDARSTDAESIFSYGKKGNKVPYIPELTASLGTGIEARHWGISLSGNYVSETWASANNVDEPVDGNGNPDVRFGKTDSYFVTDLSLFYRLREGVKLFGGAQNLFDERYIVSRQPYGPRPGMPQFLYAGIEVAIR